MTQFDKLLDTFLTTPEKLNYFDIEKIILKHSFISRPGKGSHRKLISRETGLHLTIPIHNNDCKKGYKEKLKIFYLNNK